KDRRRGVYIDFLQNVRGKTTAGPYSVRPIRRAPVSAPLRWDEIGALGRPDAFTMANMSARFASVGDLLARAHDLAQKLPKMGAKSRCRGPPFSHRVAAAPRDSGPPAAPRGDSVLTDSE